MTTLSSGTLQVKGKTLQRYREKPKSSHDEQAVGR